MPLISIDFVLHVPFAHCAVVRVRAAAGAQLQSNPYAPRVPCHRVVNQKLELHGFQGHQTCEFLQRKESLLIKEGVRVQNGHIVAHRAPQLAAVASAARRPLTAAQLEALA